MVETEKRYSRASFSKKLASMCKKLDEAPECLVEYEDFLGGIQSPLITISSLWVVGSYARGALECGDLDLVMEYSSQGGGAPMIRRISKALFGILPLVRYYSGTPAENTSGVVFTDAMQIWSGAGCNWKMAIDSIPIDPTAGRAARETDCIPLRNEQLRTYGDEMLDVARMLSEGQLESEFIAFDREMLNPLLDGGIHESEKHHFVLLGKKSRELLPCLVRMMEVQEPLGEWSGDTATTLHCGGTLIRLGMPALEVKCLEDDPSIRQLALVPHRSARGPNGAWLLRRGPTHPDVVTISDRYAYLSVWDGHPDIIYAGSNYHCSLRILELFGSEAEAKEQQAAWQDPGEEPSDIVQMKGREIMSLINCVDIIQLGDQEFAVTWAGANHLDLKRATLAEIVAALPTC